jgi:hypothetical protein
MPLARASLSETQDSLRSGGETILTFMEEGARAVISFCIRSAVRVSF